MHPGFGWVIAGLAAAAAIWGVFTGRIPMRWGGTYTRAKAPRIFWISIGVLVILFGLGLWIALWPPSN
jgi:hypothetical protein